MSAVDDPCDFCGAPATGPRCEFRLFTGPRARTAEILGVARCDRALCADCARQGLDGVVCPDHVERPPC